MIKILIVGSKGFVGNHVYDFLRNRNENQVWGCDVVPDYVDKNYFLIDATNSDFNLIFEKNSFDFCINCSGAASVPDSLNNPFRDFALNTINVFKILEAIRRYASNCKFLNLSSAAVYGNPAKLPVHETDVLAPVSPYGIHKMQAEQICQSFYRFWHIGTCNIRIFSAYGPGLKKQLFWDLYQKAISNNYEVTLFGSGLETRDFIYIDDLVQAIELVMQHAAFTGESINVANGEQISIRQAVETFYNALNYPGKIAFMGESRQGDPLNWEADIKKLKEFGYKPQYSLEEGLLTFAKWVKELP